MKNSAIVISSGVAIVGIGLAFTASRTSTKIRPHTFIGPVAVGGMSHSAAAYTVGHWWDGRKEASISLQSGLLAHPVKITADDLNVNLDIATSIHQPPDRGLMDLIRQPKNAKFAPIFRIDDNAIEGLVARLDDDLKSPSHAKVFFIGGNIHAIPESGHAEVDVARFKTRLINALATQQSVEVPFIEAPKRISNQDLASIHEVVSEFTTHFPTYKKTRCSNIQLASKKLNGIVLMPGDRLSFNGTVGRRTAEAGFQMAGVFKNGGHGVDIGGGICQVSTTLYNAALLADLKIIHRHNHSMPVAYVPLGRDATVDYGALDLELENNTDHPLAINSEYHPGKLVFRILGTKQKGLDVKIESSGRSRWSPGLQLVSDPTLAPGARKVVDKGGSGEQITTYRNVYVNGKLVRRESLGVSSYKGGQKIIAVGPAVARTPSPSGMHLVSENSH